ncbi:unnamed protein product [Tilletia caries]|nr:unnamed protein product [Tilletia caries]
MFWDYASQNPESIHQFMILFSDRGIPAGHAFQHSYAGHTSKFRGRTDYGTCSIPPPQIWLHTDYPLRPVGKITLNKNPGKYFAEIEQVAFSL